MGKVPNAVGRSPAVVKMAPGLMKLIVVGGIGAAAVTGVYFAPRVFRGVLERWRVKKSTREIDLLKRQQHFDSNHVTCANTVVNMLPSVFQAVMEYFDTSSITAQLRTDPDNKLLLWSQLKTASFSQLTAVVYGSALLVVLLHVELNVLGGTMYQEVLAAEGRGEGEESQSHTSDVQKRYLETVHYLIEKGLPLLFPLVQSSVEAVVAPVKLKDQHSVQDFANLLQRIHSDLSTQMGHSSVGISQLEGEPKSFADLMFEAEDWTKETSGDISDSYSFLLCATQDVLDSPDFPSVMDAVLKNGISAVVEVSQDIFLSSLHGLDTPTLPLAKVIPMVTDMATGVVQDSGRSKVIQAMMRTTELGQFSQAIYEAFSTA